MTRLREYDQNYYATGFDNQVVSDVEVTTHPFRHKIGTGLAPVGYFQAGKLEDILALRRYR